MDKGFLTRAVAVCVAVAFFIPFIYTIIFGYSVVYDPPMNPESFYKKSHEEQQQWLSKSTKRLNGYQTLLNRITEKRFWGEYAELFFMSFAAMFVACISFGLWERRVMRSNK